MYARIHIRVHTALAFDRGANNPELLHSTLRCTLDADGLPPPPLAPFMLLIWPPASGPLKSTRMTLMENGREKRKREKKIIDEKKKYRCYYRSE